MPIATNKETLHTIIDTQNRQTPVAHFTVPGNWKASSQVKWIWENVSQPVTVYSIAYNPEGVEWVEMLPMESFYWLEPNFGFDRPGSFKMGQFFLQPMPAVEAMNRWLVPRYRGNRQQLRVVDVQRVPGLEKKMNIPAQQLPLEGVMAKIEYLENGKQIEEELYGLMVVQQAPPSYGTAGTIIQTNWGFIRTFCFRAEKGNLDKLRSDCWGIVQSIKANPTWEQQVYTPLIQQIQQGFQQYLQAGYDQINAATRMSQMISAQNNSFLQQQQQRRDDESRIYEQRKQQEAQDYGKYTKEEAFGDMLMGRESYNDPYFQYGSQHTGYNQYVWTDGQGKYQYSNDANFDPNIGGTQSWTLMEKKTVGG